MFTYEQFQELDLKEKKEVMGWRAKFHTKKSKATAEMKRIPKNGWNDFHKYHFARESDVKDMIREILHDNQLSITNDLVNRVETEVKTSRGTATKTDVKMLFTITDAETGYFENYFHDGVTIDNSDKGIYKAYSNTIKYFLMDQFLIPTGDDVEKESPELDSKPDQQSKPQPQNNNQKQQSNNQNQQNNQQPQNSQPQALPLWKKIMNLEDKLVTASGKDKSEVRGLMKKQFGEIGIYKNLDDGKAGVIVNQLVAWIEYYSNPQG